MSSPEQEGDVVYSCRCLNVTIDAHMSSTEPPAQDYDRVFVGENGIHITHHYLTLRSRNRAQESTKSPYKLIQHLALSCLACRTLIYRVPHEISRGAEAREGPVVPTEDWIERETLRSKSGWIEIFLGRGGCLVGKRAIDQHLRSITVSDTFSIGVLSPPPTPTSPMSSPTSHPWPAASPDESKDASIPATILPSLPPLFPPPPFTPSHPVFISLSASAIRKSEKIRLRAEEKARNFVQSQLDNLEKEEAQLRKEVEGIWRGYREGWREVLGRVTEERRRSAVKPEGSASPTSAKSGVPMSIRDFSPIIRSHPLPPHSRTSSSQAARPPSPSLLSASLVQSGAHFPTQAPQSPERSPGISEPTLRSSSSHAPNSPTPLPSLNGVRLAGSSASISIKSQSDLYIPGAFKRNMDTNVDIASSVAWVQGEAEMRRRFEGVDDGKPRERARKRTSKNLGIGVVEKKPTTSAVLSAEDSVQSNPVGRSTTNGEAGRQSDIRQAFDGQIETKFSLDGGSRSPQRGSFEGHGASKKGKRRVTFDVEPEVTTTQEVKAKQARTHVDEVELFDLDDLSSTEPFPELDMRRPSKPVPPRAVIRTPPYKLRTNELASTFQPSQPGSLPAPLPMPPRSPVDGNHKWTSGSLRRSVGLADALPLLSSSVPAGDRVLMNHFRVEVGKRSHPPHTPSPRPESSALTSQAPVEPSAKERIPSPDLPSVSNEAVEPSETELKHLLAASAPSHRHAWREGGRAWEIFHRRSRDKKTTRGAIAEEESEGSAGSLEGSDNFSNEDSAFRHPWRNSSQFPHSLPIQIRPLTQYQPSLEPKTSLADKQGVLVPPLKVSDLRSNSATAIRRAVYAERDRTRSIDPGPTLDFSEQEENEEEEDIHEEVSDGGRGRRHALSILQARSVIPEAGMWRSMAS